MSDFCEQKLENKKLADVGGIVPYYQNSKLILYKGKCEDVLPALNGKIDMVLTDLPYGITSNKWDEVISFKFLWGEWTRLLKNNWVVALTASQPFTSTCVMSNVEQFRHEWIWIKNRGSNFANTVREPMKEHESVLIFSDGRWTYNKQMQERTGAGLDRVKYNLNWNSKSENYRKFEGRPKNKRGKMRVPSSWQKYNVEVGLHPNQKPVRLFEYLIKTYTLKGETILDNCAGSGVAGIAAINTGRKVILIEEQERYCNIIVERIKKLGLFDGEHF